MRSPGSPSFRACESAALQRLGLFSVESEPACDPAVLAGESGPFQNVSYVSPLSRLRRSQMGQVPSWQVHAVDAHRHLAGLGVCLNFCNASLNLSEALKNLLKPCSSFGQLSNVEFKVWEICSVERMGVLTKPNTPKA